MYASSCYLVFCSEHQNPVRTNNLNKQISLHGLLICTTGQSKVTLPLLSYSIDSNSTMDKTRADQLLTSSFLGNSLNNRLFYLCSDNRVCLCKLPKRKQKPDSSLNKVQENFFLMSEPRQTSVIKNSLSLSHSNIQHVPGRKLEVFKVANLHKSP